MRKILAILCALVLSVNTANAATLATDAFTGGDSNPIGGNWTTISGGLGDCQRVSNALRGTSTGARNGCRYTGVTTPDDSYSQVKLVTFASSASSKGAEALIRVAAGSESYYSCAVVGTGTFGTLAVDLYERSSGTYTSLAYNGSYTVNSNAIVKVSAQGTTIKCLIDGAEVHSVTDSTHTSGQAGILINVPDATSDVVIDDFEVGDFSVGGKKRIVTVVQ